ncbi:phosphomevalonate kinase-like isoform X1 [Macrobrachium nipponense]|uniref:phosphomevalonate kinase-like isoform X1 n=1 Tax=Macrobrachium nipponense TaxID=159736 RepID=UPI0030C8294A
MPENPAVILLFSGKRKSGKDYITDLLQSRIGNDLSKILRLSGPIKQQFALDNGLDYEKLLSASEYKEKYRLEMISWSEAKRAKDSGFFIRAAIEMFEASKFPVWIVSDMRRRSDLQWFKENYGDVLYSVRIKTSIEVREKRGWIFTPGVDDAESECDLDNITDWDQEIQNNTESVEDLDPVLNQLKHYCISKLKSL